jgi:hypothetical protein
MTDIAALKEAALSATPSPAECDINCDDPFCHYVHHPVVDAAAERDYIALANPSTILSLIASHSTLVEALGNLLASCPERLHCGVHCEAEIPRNEEEAYQAALKSAERALQSIQPVEEKKL